MALPMKFVCESLVLAVLIAQPLSVLFILTVMPIGSSDDDDDEDEGGIRYERG
jgi:hypothetical protein